MKPPEDSLPCLCARDINCQLRLVPRAARWKVLGARRSDVRAGTGIALLGNLRAKTSEDMSYAMITSDKFGTPCKNFR